MARQLAILIVSPHGYVEKDPCLGKVDTGGQILFLLEVSKRFSAAGHHVDLATRKFKQQNNVDYLCPRRRILRIPFGGRNFIKKESMHNYLDEFALNLLSFISFQKLTYDLIYSHYWDGGWAGKKVAEALKIPHVHTPHSVGITTQRQYMIDLSENSNQIISYRFPERIAKERLIFSSSDHLVAVNPSQKRVIADEYRVPENRISVIPPGVDSNHFNPISISGVAALQRKHRLSQKDILILGRMAYNKGYDLIVRAMVTVLTIVPDARLVAAIESDDNKDVALETTILKEIAQDFGIADRILWRNRLSTEELIDYYRSCGIFALPSRNEPFGMAALEAMACGAPSVVTIHGGISEFITFGHQGLYGDPRCAEEFGTMLAMPLRYHRLSDQLSSCGSSFAKEHFCWEKISKKIIDQFYSILGRGSRQKQKNRSTIK